MIVLLFMATIVAAPFAIREFIIALSCRMDDGRVVFQHAMEAMRENAGDWSKCSPGFWGSGYARGQMRVWLSDTTEPFLFLQDMLVANGHHEIKAGYGWKRRLNRQMKRLRADLRKMNRLNAISDTMEAMMRSHPNAG